MLGWGFLETFLFTPHEQIASRTTVKLTFIFIMLHCQLDKYALTLSLYPHTSELYSLPVIFTLYAIPREWTKMFYSATEKVRIFSKWFVLEFCQFFRPWYSLALTFTSSLIHCDYSPVIVESIGSIPYGMIHYHKYESQRYSLLCFVFWCAHLLPSLSQKSINTDDTIEGRSIESCSIGNRRDRGPGGLRGCLQVRRDSGNFLLVLCVMCCLDLSLEGGEYWKIIVLVCCGGWLEWIIVFVKLWQVF